MQAVGRTLTWNIHMGKRFLNADQFIELCKEVGLHNVTLSELEEYEHRGWMYPAARLVMPTNYAQAFWNNQLTGAEFQFDDVYRPYHELEMTLRYSYPPSHISPSETDLRHPIDKAWGKVEGLHSPKDETYQSWDSYNISIEDNPFSTTTHFYHYWQVYELYQVRREHKGMYQDYTQQFPKSLEFGDIEALVPFFDALSYFQHLYRSRYRQIVDPIQPDADGYATFDIQQQQDIEQSARNYATQTLVMYRLNESDLYNALKGMLFLHHCYEQSERYKLAETLKFDVWRMVELIGFAFSVSSEAISDRIGYVGNGMSNQKSLEILFPNRRKITREEAGKILASISTDYNKTTQNHQFSSQDKDELLDFVEATDLAVFEYALVELNETYFNRTSWYAEEAFLRLKSVASFPESLMRELIIRSGDSALQAVLNTPRSGMGTFIQSLYQAKYRHTIWNEYVTAGHRDANNVQDFKTNTTHLISIKVRATNENQFIGIDLSLAALLRNFTHHHSVVQTNLLRGQYVHSVRAILNTAFFVWKDAKSRGWV